MSKNPKSPEQTIPAEDTNLYLYWQKLGLRPRAARALAIFECRTVNDIRNVGVREFPKTTNCGKKSLKEIEDFIGGWRIPFSPHDELTRLRVKVNRINKICETYETRRSSDPHEALTQIRHVLNT